VSDRGLLHQHHRLLGRLVRDTAHDRIGTLQAIAPDTDTTTPVAWLRPPHGGTEWTTPAKAVVSADTALPASPSAARSA
jgi:hypothetical protein